jgi:hypothetical protein
MSQTDHRLAISTAGLSSARAVDTVAESEWDATVRRLGGDAVYSSLGYHRASALLEPPGTLPALLSDGESALPLLLRPLTPDTWDASSAYGYGGPLAARADPAFGAGVDAWARANGVVTTFLRYHPLLGNHRIGPRDVHVAERGWVVAWDLRGTRDLYASMHDHHRRAVRKAAKAGVRVAVTVAPANLRVFRALYEVTMRRQEADPFYFFPTGYWEELLAGCGDRLVLCEAFLDDEPVAALLCFDSAPFLHYHLGASSDTARRVGASNLLFLTAAAWGREHGHESFFLGGGLGGSSTSSLFVFKHRFDPASEPLPWHTGAWVHDAARYRELAGTSSVDGYFPPWRAPHVPAQRTTP